MANLITIKENVRIKLENLVSDMPSLAREYLIQDSNHSLNTRLLYGYDLHLFLFWLAQKNNKKIIDLSINDFKVQPKLIEEFLQFASMYERNGTLYKNQIHGLKQKLTSLRNFYRHLYRKGLVEYNPAATVELPVIEYSPHFTLTLDQVKAIIQYIAGQSDLYASDPKNAMEYVSRDIAIISLFADTGMRLSELYSLDVHNYDAFSHTIKTDAYTYELSDWANKNLVKYTMCRRDGNYDDQHALFISCRHNRMSMSAIERMTSKYISKALPVITNEKRLSTSCLRTNKNKIC